LTIIRLKLSKEDRRNFFAPFSYSPCNGEEQKLLSNKFKKLNLPREAERVILVSIETVNTKKIYEIW